MKSFSADRSQLKDKLVSKKLTIGTWLTIPHQTIIEVLSTAGFEWMVIDMEHSPIDFQLMQNLIGHIQGNGMQALVRIAKNDEVQIKKALDSGADGIIVPMVRSEQEAEQVISYAKYPPYGSRGVGLARANQYGNIFDKYVEWVKNDLIIIFQIEHIDSVKSLDKILSVKDLDGIIVGPYDLSASLGKPGKFDDDEVVSALEYVVSLTQKMNLSLGFHVISSDFQSSLDKINKGYNFIAFSIDYNFLGNSAREEMYKLKRHIQ